MTLPERIANKIEVDEVTGCWNWTAFKRSGYGKTAWNGGTAQAHRVVYHLLVDPDLPVYSGYTSDRLLDHLCHNRSCVNPDHLRSVTNRENCSAGLCGVLGASNQTSKALGVTKVSDQRAARWQAGVKVKRRRIFLGYRNEESQAARLYDAARLLIDNTTPNADRGLCDPPSAEDVTIAAKRLTARGAAKDIRSACVSPAGVSGSGSGFPASPVEPDPDCSQEVGR